MVSDGDRNRRWAIIKHKKKRIEEGVDEFLQMDQSSEGEDFLNGVRYACENFHLILNRIL